MIQIDEPIKIKVFDGILSRVFGFCANMNIDIAVSFCHEKNDNDIDVYMAKITTPEPNVVNALIQGMMWEKNQENFKYLLNS